MARYIDAEKLIDGRVSNDPVVIAAKCEPTADVQEVRYGEWKKKKSATGNGFYYFCTACYPHIDYFTTHEEEFDFVKAFKYCPYCGAKMRTKEEQTCK